MEQATLASLCEWQLAHRIRGDECDHARFGPAFLCSMRTALTIANGVTPGAIHLSLRSTPQDSKRSPPPHCQRRASRARLPRCATSGALRAAQRHRSPLVAASHAIKGDSRRKDAATAPARDVQTAHNAPPTWRASGRYTRLYVAARALCASRVRAEPAASCLMDARHDTRRAQPAARWPAPAPDACTAATALESRASLSADSVSAVEPLCSAWA